ncbi:hypothetical protein ACIBI9_12225 [Nonomuraea sp. NPDC050451]|uniref:hypothetical protein n=1 Tax=Nonomuraea sp. NPDC050451 TaxID=3364364 RepID=UPI003792F0A2
MISDEVWGRLGPRAGMVRRISYGRWHLAGIAVLLAGGAWMSGAFVPRLSHSTGSGDTTTTYQDELDGGGAFPRSLPPGRQMTLRLVLDVTDCRAALTEDVPLVVEAERWWGRTTAEAQAEEPWHTSSIESACRVNAS